LNGQVTQTKGYQTFLLRDLALDFIRESAADPGKPFFLIFTPYAPHLPAVPAPGDEALYEDIAASRPPSFNEEDVSDKPIWMQETAPLDNERIQLIDDRRLAHIRTLNGLDQAVESIMEELDSAGLLENTVVFYISDNGLFWGEHRIGGGKIQVYEEASHVPFAVRYPPLITAPRIDSALVGNIDIAPTIYELAGLPIPRVANGMSLVPLLTQQGEWRDALLLEAWPKQSSDFPAYQAVETEQYVYVNYGEDFELYDLINDPYQLNNLSGDPATADLIAQLQAKLKELVAQ
jgi:arylsulfatase A-like enzyme